jgi:hypothetical protein
MTHTVDPVPEPDPIPPPRVVEDDGLPPGLDYRAAYWIGMFITAILAVIGAIEVGWNAGAGASMGITPEAFAAISLLGVFLGVIGRAFPNVQYTPSARNREFDRAVNYLRLPKGVRIHPPPRPRP